jgi:peroxiredoxin/predicted 2-oxoglutarate/Fe(II)-dependent dioxygenase YbiX
MPQYASLMPGDPAPWFHQRSFANPNYAFDTAAGRYIVLCFFASAADVQVRNNLLLIHRQTQVFDDTKASFFGVSADPADESQKRVSDHYPGFRYLWDFDTKVSRLYGSVPHDATQGVSLSDVRRMWVILDPTLRVLNVIPFSSSGSEVREVIDYLVALPPPTRFAGIPVPILVLPNVFEPEFCQQLIGLYEKNGGEESGFMREIDGKTVAVTNYNHKRRKDYMIEDQTIIRATQARVMRRINPEIEKVHQFKPTRMERYLVGCYAAEDEAHFRAHRDNTTKGTAHRRFAVSINLNSDFDGGEVSFPEYGPRGFKAPPGGAVIFSCSLLHAVSKVTRGRRYAFLPFLYDDAAAKIREANNVYLGEGVGAYKSS